MARRNQTGAARWPHRLALTLACASLLSIAVGGLVTSYGAGGVARDGPGGLHNFVFLYPVGDLGVSGIFLEHFHRLLGTVSLLVGTALAFVLWRIDLGKGPKRLALFTAGGLWLASVCGGFSALSRHSEPITILGIGAPLLFTWLHAWLAPVVAALAVVLLGQTAKETPAAGRTERPVGGLTRSLAWLVTGGVYLQIVLEVQLRHVALDVATWWFTLAVWLDWLVTGLVVCGLAWLLFRTRVHSDSRRIVAWARLLGVFYGLRVVSGICAWVTNYGWPIWFTERTLAWEYNIVAQSGLQVGASVAHVTFASLSLAAAAALSIEVCRAAPTGQTSASKNLERPVR